MALVHAGPPPRDAPFVEGDLLDEAFLPHLPLSRAHAPSAEPIPDGQIPIRDFGALTTLAPLQHRISAIFAERLFHLLPFVHQADLAARLAPLLVPKKGAMVFGRQRGGKSSRPRRTTRAWTSSFTRRSRGARCGRRRSRTER
jgi:hypothetical protein